MTWHTCTCTWKQYCDREPNWLSKTENIILFFIHCPFPFPSTPSLLLLTPCEWIWYRTVIYMFLFSSVFDSCIAIFSSRGSGTNSVVAILSSNSSCTALVLLCVSVVRHSEHSDITGFQRFIWCSMLCNILDAVSSPVLEPFSLCLCNRRPSG